MKNRLISLALLLCLLLSFTTAHADEASAVQHLNSIQASLDMIAARGVTDPSSPYAIYDMGVPQIGDKKCTDGQMNMVIFWVQTQLQATGKYYQRPNCHITGRMGDATIKAVKDFMVDQGKVASANSAITQTVIDTLAEYLGDKLVPVYTGGFYTKMEKLYSSSAFYGTMEDIISNLIREPVSDYYDRRAEFIQKCLKGCGVYTWDVDGKYGEYTQRAVLSFQRYYGFTDRKDRVYLGVARKMLELYFLTGGDLNLL